jgi:Rv2175c C-terminal domain of unknown function
MPAEIELLTEAEAGELLGLDATRVHQMVRDGVLLALRRDGRRGIPAMFIQDGVVVKHLSAVLTQLRDVRYDDDEIVDWLFREDDSLPGSPLRALRENRGTEVKRRAQIAGY